jgi:allantoate deiminase
MTVQVGRIQRNIEEAARLNASPELGITRFSYTEEHKRAQEYVIEEMKAAGLEIRIDAVGNIFGRREGAVPGRRPVLIGSHIDTVKNGGAFDGMAGLAVGLEIARVLQEMNAQTTHPVEIISIVEEEGGRFSSGLLGSRTMAGRVSRKDLDNFSDEDGVTIAEAMKDFGLDPERLQEAVLSPQEIEAYIELHIEQGPVLENEGLDLGIVDSIVGITAYEVEINGRPDHAGTTPMNMRYDALAAASRIIQGIRGFAGEKNDGTVATVGKLELSPGAVNIVPGRVVFTFESRSKNFSSVEDVVKKINVLLQHVCEGDGLSYSMKKLVELEPTPMNGEIVSRLEQSAKELGIPHRKMHSGAGHDAMFMAGITKAGLIFVPSKNGRSHCPEEWSEYEKIARGAELILDALNNYS